jgi:hypothetical protein
VKPVVAAGVVDEGLTAPAHRHRLGDRDALPAQFSHGRVEIGHRQGEMLAERRRHVGLDEVDLLVPGIKPGPAETEVRTVGALGQAEQPGVEVPCRGDVADVDRYVVQPSRSHGSSLPAPALPRQVSPPAGW